MSMQVGGDDDCYYWYSFKIFQIQTFYRWENYDQMKQYVI